MIARFVERCVAVFILSVFVFWGLAAMVNCILSTTRDVQAPRLEPTLEIYRAYHLMPETVRMHNDEMEGRYRSEYEQMARGGQ